MNQCSHQCGAYPSAYNGRYHFGCRIQCACAQTCTDSYFNGRVCQPIEKNNPACCPAACPLNCPKPPTCSYSGLSSQYKCSCLGVNFVDPTRPDQNDLYLTNHQPLRPVAQPIQHYRPEILGTNSDDRSFLAANTNINYPGYAYPGYAYPGMHPAQAYDQYMSSLDQVSGRGPVTYYKPRYP